MLKWYSDLYIGEKANKKTKSIIRKINKGQGQITAFVITLAYNEEDQLEVFNASLLLQQLARETCPMIIGIASGYDEAIELVTRITEEVYQETGTTDIRAYLEEKEVARS